MSHSLGIKKLKEHDFYHLKYGRGAVVVAAPAGSHANRAISRKNTAANLARLYNMRKQGGYQVSPEFDEVISIQESDGFVTIVIKFVHQNPQTSSRVKPESGLIKRVIPVWQVTLEVVESVDSV